MNLLAPAASESLEVPICWSVLHHGANARAEDRRGEPLFPHRHVPPAPATLPDEREWLAALDFAERARRSNQAGRAKLDLSKRDGAGSNGSMGSCGPGQVWVMASSRGIEVGEPPTSRLLTWPKLLAARSEQRAVEVEVARARDLAQAYHCLDYYGHVYPEPEEGDRWSPAPLIKRLAAEARDLGGDPTLLKPRSDYMREALSA